MTALATDLYQLVEGRHGRFLANPQDIYMGRSMIAYGEFSDLEWQLLAQIAKPNAVVIEVGANMGCFTVPLAKAVGRSGLVYAFEPQPIVFQQLCANLALNDLVNVQAFNAGCSDAAGWMPIKRVDPAREVNFGGLSLAALEGASPIRVRIETLDEVLDPPRLTLIKADVEGMEVQVLRGAAGLISRFRPVLYLEAHTAEETPPLLRHLAELDYDAFWHQPRMFNPANHFSNSENLFQNIVSRNLLCTPAERKVQIEGARKVSGPDDHPTKWAVRKAVRGEAESD